MWEVYQTYKKNSMNMRVAETVILRLLTCQSNWFTQKKILRQKKLANESDSSMD